MDKIFEKLKMNRINGAVLFSIYFIVNFLFLLKYGIRQSFVPMAVLAVVFIAINGSFFMLRNNKFFSKRINKKLIYFTIAIITVLYFFLCHIMKDPYKMNIDRWQTLEYSLQYWLKGKYIYDVPNFMGNVSSYLPGQLIFAFIPYVMGNVGYLQIIAFLLFSYAIIREFKSNFIRLQGILMMGISLSYVYEVVCKSDFISSFIFAAAFMVFWNSRFRDNYFKKPLLLGICLGIIVLTRSIVLIPLIIFLLKSFLKTTWDAKIKTVFTCVATVSILLATVLWPAKDLDYILQHNPLQLQGQSNTFVMLFFVVLAVVSSFFVKKINDVFNFSTYITFFLMVGFVLEQYLIKGYGYQDNLFSTTYLAACLPFSIIGYCYAVQEESQ